MTNSESFDSLLTIPPPDPLPRSGTLLPSPSVTIKPKTRAQLGSPKQQQQSPKISTRIAHDKRIARARSSTIAERQKVQTLKKASKNADKSPTKLRDTGDKKENSPSGKNIVKKTSEDSRTSEEKSPMKNSSKEKSPPSKEKSPPHKEKSFSSKEKLSPRLKLTGQSPSKKTPEEKSPTTTKSPRKNVDERAPTKERARRERRKSNDVMMKGSISPSSKERSPGGKISLNNTANPKRSVSTRKLRTRSYMVRSELVTSDNNDKGAGTTSPKTTKRRTHSRLPRINTTKEEKKERPEEKTILGAIKRVLEQPWFHGDISKEDADSSLATSRNIEGPKIFGSHGDFLVRVSLSEPVEKHPFTISKANKKGVIYHQRIFYNEEENTYVVLTKSEQFPQVCGDSIISLVKQLLELKIVNQPCKRWNYARKYADIFEKKQTQDGGYVDIDKGDKEEL